MEFDRRAVIFAVFEYDFHSQTLHKMNGCSSGNASCGVVQQGKLFGNGKGCWEAMQLRAEVQPETKKVSSTFSKILTCKLCLQDT